MGRNCMNYYRCMEANKDRNNKIGEKIEAKNIQK